MPQYRKLSTRTPESFDFEDLGDDFTRLMWLLLPTQSCSAGRGIADDRILKSKLFPLRVDIKPGQCIAAMQKMAALDMVRTYSVQGRDYYEIVNWEKHQGNTTKEAASPYPSFDEADEIEVIGVFEGNSGPTPDQLRTNSGTDAVFSIQYSDADAVADSAQPKSDEPDPKKAYQAFVEKFIDDWVRLYPAKPKPRTTGKAFKEHFPVRYREKFFRDNYLAAMERGAKSQFLAGSGWYNALWLIANAGNMEKVLDGNYDDRPDHRNGTAPPVATEQYLPDANGRF